MLRPADLTTFLRLKRRLGRVVLDGSDGFAPSKRELSEGLARSLVIDGERWTYSPERHGYRFSCPRGRLSIFVTDDQADHDQFTANELTDYLQNHTTHERINAIVVDHWLIRAVQHGLCKPVPHRPGYYAAREAEPETARHATRG